MTAPVVRYQNQFQDTDRWERIALRDDDIIISTPPKCGTTWTQIICALLIFGRPELPGRLDDLSIWPDFFRHSPDEVATRLGAQHHRRFMKTHTPLDGLPSHEGVSYIGVVRDPRDAGISWDNHLANTDFETLLRIRAERLGPDAAPLDLPEPAPTQRERFWQWAESSDGAASLTGMIQHATVLWERREDPDVLLLHFEDLRTDLDGQMRRVADFLGTRIDDAVWPDLVRAATFDEVRGTEAFVPDQGIWKDRKEFFHKGTSGQWRDVLDDDDLARYRALVGTLASPEVTAWLHRGPV